MVVIVCVCVTVILYCGPWMCLESGSCTYQTDLSATETSERRWEKREEIECMGVEEEGESVGRWRTARETSLVLSQSCPTRWF